MLLILFLSSIFQNMLVFSHLPMDDFKCDPEKYNRFDNSQMEIVWINLDKSIERRNSIERQMKQARFMHRRSRGLTPDDILIPADVEKVWCTDHALTRTNLILRNMTTILKEKYKVIM